jgi:hypothetical protein
MNAFTPSREEQAEVAAVLQSGTFQRAPLLENFFRYICEQYFEGQGCQIKEYSIAVEALGRPPAFDPKKDSIVRVEAHRLRKRLQEYYEGPGKSHAIHILIPNGQYAPQFVPGDSTTEFAQVELLPPALEEVPAVRTPMSPAGRKPWRLIAIAAALILAGALVLASRNLSHLRNRIAGAPVNERWTGAAAGPVPMEFRMLAGYHGPPVTDDNGHTWNADCYYSGGQSVSIAADRSIEGQQEPHWLKAQRTGAFQYDIPLRQGTYELHLYFSETEYGLGNPRGGGDGTRLFDVTINGTQRIIGLDPLAEAGGPNRMYARVLKDVAPASDGKLHLKFEPSTAPAFLNALEILSSAPGQIRPVRIVTQPSPVTDSEGHVWSADQYFTGGTLVFRKDSVSNLRGKVLYQGER